MYHGLTVNWCNLKENILLVQKEIKIKVVTSSLKLPSRPTGASIFPAPPQSSYESQCAF